jgi:3-oxoadipate CoA-transferase, beta subunit
VTPGCHPPRKLRPWSLDQVAAHVARDLPPGSYVNIGIGLPTLVPRHIPADRDVVLHSENGILGLGPPPSPDAADPELIDAGKNLASLVPGGSYFSHAEAFAMIRGGHLDVAVLGAFQVSHDGDLANWSMPGEKLPAVGGAMDLAAGARQVVVLTRHVARDGTPKLVARCSYPLTAARVVSRVYTDLATMDIADSRFIVLETAPGLELSHLQQVTGGEVEWPDRNRLPRPPGQHVRSQPRATNWPSPAAGQQPAKSLAP